LLAIFYALDIEAREIKDRMIIEKIRVEHDLRVFEGHLNHRKIILVLTGVGKRRAQNAARKVFQQYLVSGVISTGCCGALNNMFAAGDIVVYTQIKSTGGMGMSTVNSNSELMEQALKYHYDRRMVRLAKGISVDIVCAAPESKSRLGIEFAADVVDMESYWIGEIAQETGLPFIAIRAVADSVQDDLSFLDRIVVKGKLKPLKTAGYFILHPHDLITAVECSRNIQKAGKNLAYFFSQFVN
jgi:adenosylhomocysteine nucleosidase